MVDVRPPFYQLLNFQKISDTPIYQEHLIYMLAIQEYIKIFKKSVLWSFYYKALLSVIPIKITWNFLSGKIIQKF